MPNEFEVHAELAETATPVEFPRIDEIPPMVPLADLKRALEAMLAGMYSNAPDSLLEDWQETADEGERLLMELDEKLSGARG